MPPTAPAPPPSPWSEESSGESSHPGFLQAPARCNPEMRWRVLCLLFLFAAMLCMTAGALELRPADATGSGMLKGEGGREMLFFEPLAPRGTAAFWSLDEALPAGWHTVEITFGPEDQSRKLIDFQCIDEAGGTLLSTDLYHLPSKSGGRADVTFAIFLPRPSKEIRWVKNQVRNMKSAPLMGLRIVPGKPDPRRSVIEVVAAVVVGGEVALPGDLGSGHWRAWCDVPVGLRWRDRGGAGFETPRASATMVYLGSPLDGLDVIEGSPASLMLERRPDSQPPEGMREAQEGMLPLFSGERRKWILEVEGDGLDPQAVSVAGFPEGARMAAVQSWDDGIPQDLRTAELLHRHGWRGTFFLNRNSPMVGQWERLAALGMEVGSHSWSHPFYPLQSPQRCHDESVLMRSFLESVTGHPVISFAYPFNYGAAYDKDGDYVLRAQRDAGYLSSRTTIPGAFSMDDGGNRQVLPSGVHFRVGAKRIDEEWRRAAASQRGVFYLWGHSYEMASDADWKDFEAMLERYGKRDGVWYASQGDLMVWEEWRSRARVHATGDAGKLTIHVDSEMPHAWWARRIPFALRVPGKLSRVSGGIPGLKIIGGGVGMSAEAYGTPASDQ